jgi:hypothetical protein
MSTQDSTIAGASDSDGGRRQSLKGAYHKFKQSISRKGSESPSATPEPTIEDTKVVAATPAEPILEPQNE